MKKTLSILMIVVLLVGGLFVLTGCGNNENEEDNKKSTTNEFLIGEKSLKFNIDKTFGDFMYKTAEEIKTSETSVDTKLTYENRSFYDDKFVFEINMFVMKNYSFSEWQFGPKEGEYENITINNIKWKVYTTNSNGYTVKFYAADENNSLYVFRITKFSNADVDIERLSNIFMNGVTLNNN